MKKPSKETMRNKLDKVCGQLVRSIGRCQVCNSNEKLQWSHAFSRSIWGTRWDFRNVYCWCASCHGKFHKSPLEMREWVHDFLGDEKYWELIRYKNTYKKFTLEELQELYERFIQITKPK